MKTAVTALIILCLGSAAAASAAADEEQARARLQLAMERALAEVDKGWQGAALSSSAPASAGGSARRLAGGGGHVGVISRAHYPEDDPTCATQPLRWDVIAPHHFTGGACESIMHEGLPFSTRGSCSSATSFSSSIYQGSLCSGTPLDTKEVTSGDCAPNYEASYSYSFSYGDLDGYGKLGCPAIPAADVAATTTYYFGSGTCADGDDKLKSYQVWHGGCYLQSEPDDPVQISVKYSCDAKDGFHVEGYTSSDCTGTPLLQLMALETGTCTNMNEQSSFKVICGCAADVGCSDVVDAAAARGPLLATAVLGAAAAAL